MLGRNLMRLLWFTVAWGGVRALDTAEMFGRARRVLVCVRGRDEPCEGALWRPQWVLTSAACLRGTLLPDLFVVHHPTLTRCSDDYLFSGEQLGNTQRVYSGFLHPEYEVDAAADAMMLTLYNRLYVGRAPWPANSSGSFEVLEKLKPWMEELYETVPVRDPYDTFPRHEHFLICSPLRMFLTLVAAPALLSTLFFGYVIFYAGTTHQEPYKTLGKDEENQTETEVKVVDPAGDYDDDKEYVKHCVLEDLTQYEDTEPSVWDELVSEEMRATNFSTLRYDPRMNPWGI